MHALFDGICGVDHRACRRGDNKERNHLSHAVRQDAKKVGYFGLCDPCAKLGNSASAASTLGTVKIDLRVAAGPSRAFQPA